MVTTRRSSEYANSSYEPRMATAGVGVLDRPERLEEKYSTAVTVGDNTQEAEERRRNLDKLLNYDRYTEQASVVEEKEVEQATIVNSSSLSDEDIRPTSTTLQFGDGNGEKLLKDLNVSHEVSDTKSYRLSSKGRLVVVLYSLIVAVVLAFVIVNTGILASLDTSAANKSAELDTAINEYNVVQERVDSISNDDYVIDVAENELGMVPRA